MSAFGAIVIQPMKKNTAPAPVQWDEELVMLLSDGYHVSEVCRC